MNSTLLSNRLLAKNIVWNFLGGALPLLAAIAAIPILTRDMGIDRFGILTLAWVLVGYFGLFDLGLSRALTKLVSDRIGSGNHAEIPDVFWTSLLLMSTLGLAGTFAVFLLSPWLVDDVLRTPSTIRIDTIHSFFLLGVSVPVVIGTAGFRGYLEARQRFRISNAIRIPMSAFNFLGPLLVLPLSDSLTAVVGVLVVGRIIAWVAYFRSCIRVDPALRHIRKINSYLLRSILRFGGWTTVSNVLGPVMTYFDRFLVGALISVGAVAYYATPYEAVTRLWVVPAAIAGVLFPAFSTTSVSDRAYMGRLFVRGSRFVVLILFPLALLAVLFAPEILRTWLGNDFAQHSSTVWQFLAVGIFINSLAQIPFALLQGMDRPDLTAKFHIFELCLYVPSVWWVTKEYGIEGTAAAWSARVALDALLLFGSVRKFLPELRRAIIKLGLLAFVCLLVLGVSSVRTTLELKLVFLSVVLTGFGFIAWFWVLTPRERSVIVSRLKPLRISERG